VEFIKPVNIIIGKACLNSHEQLFVSDKYAKVNKQQCARLC
jgi:hypothetical protein